ncbi:hypothetical protein HYV89_04730 [Candidatus Woesearchaeota archaeon]|nr:hypothetical protein [Candidatus Woesearchaeota archaeon]
MSINHRGQLEIGITTMVLIVFIVLLLLSLILYFKFTYLELEEDRTTLLDQKYNSILSVIIGLPEFRCSRGGIESECLDAAKLSAFSGVYASNKEHYGNIFGTVNGIWVDVPVNDVNNLNYPDQGRFSVYGKADLKGGIYSVPVSLYYPESKKYKIGILKIRGEL